MTDIDIWRNPRIIRLRSSAERKDKPLTPTPPRREAPGATYQYSSYLGFGTHEVRGEMGDIYGRSNAFELPALVS